DKALADPVSSKELKTKFDRWYRAHAFESWRQFVAAFPQGAFKLRNKDEWQQAAAQMGTDKGAYTALLNHVGQEFDALPVDELPAWLQHLQKARRLKTSVDYWSYHQALEKAIKATADGTQAVQAVTQAFGDPAAAKASPFGAAFAALARL